MADRGRYEELIERVRGLVTSLDRVPVVAIAGHGGAGKSTLALRLAGDLGVTAEQIVATDALYGERSGPDAGLWEHTNWAALGELLAQCRSVPRPHRLVYRYRWWGGQTGAVDELMPPVLIVEGVRLLGDHTKGWFDLTVWLPMDPDTAGERAKARNRLQGDDEAELELWDTKWIPEGWAYERMIDPANRADLVMDPSTA